jgi:IclR family acetate operon transcriptional repressor
MIAPVVSLLTINHPRSDTGKVDSTDWNVPASPTDTMIGRVSAVLDCFLDGRPSLTLTQICERTALPKSTASRITSELVEHSYLERHGSYLSLGIRVFELGQQAARPRSLKILALPRMAELRRATGHTVHLAILEDITVVYIEILASSASPRLPSRVGGRLPAFATGVGKVLLAFSPAGVTERIISRGLYKIGPNTITEPDELRETLRGIRSVGVAAEIEESGPGISCVAAPILDSRSRAIAAISVSGWRDRLDVAAATPVVRGVAVALSEEVRRIPQLVQVD